MPQNAAAAKFLNEEEKKLAYHRIQVDSSSVVNEEFNLRESLKIFRQPSTYTFLTIEMCLGVPLQSVSLFLPQIVGRLKYSTIKTSMSIYLVSTAYRQSRFKDKLEAILTLPLDLYTVAPNITGAVMLLILAFTSDFTRRRGPFIVLGFLFTFTGFIIYAAIDVLDHLHVAYFATFMMC